MSKVFTLEDLENMGYVETSPGVFSKRASEKLLPVFEEGEVKKNAKVGKYAKIKAGKYTVAGTVYNFRSEWEYIYALLLQYYKESGNIEDWEYEPQRFDFPIKRGSNSYLPDFKIIELDGNHWWAEVKGYLDQKGHTKLKRFAKYYPEERLKVIRKDEIDAIKNSGLISKKDLS